MHFAFVIWLIQTQILHKHKCIDRSFVYLGNVNRFLILQFLQNWTWSSRQFLKCWLCPCFLYFYMTHINCNLYEIDFSSKKVVVVAKGLSANNFCHACLTDLFCSLIKTSLSPLFLADNVKLDVIPNKIKWKIHTCFTLLF